MRSSATTPRSRAGSCALNGVVRATATRSVAAMAGMISDLHRCLSEMHFRQYIHMDFGGVGSVKFALLPSRLRAFPAWSIASTHCIFTRTLVRDLT